MGGVYHVVCHECQFEELYKSATMATGECESHEKEHDHRVSYLEIDRPESPPEI